MGDKDVLGQAYGNLFLFKNTGTKTNPVYGYTAPLAGGTSIFYFSPAFGDVNGDGAADLFYGTLEVIEESKIPGAYWKPQPPKLDRQGVLAALKGGTAIDGVALAPPQLQLSVRTR